jgi:hypothetical protein
MSNDQYTPFRRRVLSLGLTGAVVGTAGCTGMVNVETEGDSESGTDDTEEPSADIDAASFTFNYDLEAQQVEIVFDGGAGITASNLQVQHTSGREVIWAELGSTTAAPDEEISQGATALLGPNILNWEVPVLEDDSIRLVYVGNETPATLERYSPPEPTDSESTVPASVSSFSIESQSDQRVQVSFNSSKQLETITVSVFGPEDTTLIESDFTESHTEDSDYTYEASYEASSAGEFEATLDEAVDVNGYGSLNGQSISDTTALSSADTTPPSISAFSIANPSDHQLRTSFDSDEQLSTILVTIDGSESTTLTESNFSRTNTGNGTYTYEGLYNVSSDGEFTATLEKAADNKSNNGAGNQSVSISLSNSLNTQFNDGFEDGDLDENWSIVWQNFGDIEPTNNWKTTREQPISGNQSLYLLASGDPNVLATNNRIIDLSEEFEFSVKYHVISDNNRGPRIRLIDTDKNGSQGDYIEVDSVTFGGISGSGSAYGRSNGQFRLFDKEIEISSDSLTTGADHQITVTREENEIKGYHDGNLIVTIPVGDIITDLSTTYRLALANSGTWGSESEIYFDDILYKSSKS